MKQSLGAEILKMYSLPQVNIQDALLHFLHSVEMYNQFVSLRVHIYIIVTHSITFFLAADINFLKILFAACFHFVLSFTFAHFGTSLKAAQAQGIFHNFDGNVTFK